MRHNVKGRKLGRTTEHRQAMFRNQLASLVESGRIRTTLMKAKELRPIAEKIVTKGKRGTVDARRQVRRWLAQRELVKKLFDEVAPRFQERNGGYLRILKLGPRPGDGAEMAFLEWVDYQLAGTDKKAKAEKPTKGKGKAAAAEGEEAEGEEKPAKKTAKPAAKAPKKPPTKPTGRGQAPTKPPAAAKKRSTQRKAGSE
ncbi:MAG TPA: 50S ribosomal protein L17 [Thermoanaerobaculia bacterium]|jgi:large subunit ribosomal protein L17|nr:50S ribosomal protein L17 [Thermoanaerobaculia bacterium]